MLVGFLKKEKYRIVIKNLSRADRDILDKFNKEFVQDRSEKEDGRKIKDELGEEIDLNNLNKVVPKEAVLKLQFGRLKEVGREGEPEEGEGVFLDYQQYFEQGSTEFFQVNKGLVFDFIQKESFADSFRFEDDWKVRYYALEEIYLALCKLDKLKNDQLWNINKFIYVQLNCGLRMEFLDTYRTSRLIKLSIKDHRDGFLSVLLA